MVTEPPLLTATLVCESEQCQGNTSFVVFEQGVALITCPMCDSLQPVPTRTRSFPSGRCTGCGEPLEAVRHWWEKIPGSWMLISCSQRRGSDA